MRISPTRPHARSVLPATAALSMLLLTAACGGSSGSGAGASATTSTTTGPSSDATTGSSSGSTSSADFKDGSYEGKGSYSNPGGTSSVDVKLTLASGRITAITVTPGAQGTSLAYQKEFISGIKAKTVGKSIESLKVSKVSGSSLTSIGFNEAIDAIKADAQA